MWDTIVSATNMLLKIFFAILILIAGAVWLTQMHLVFAQVQSADSVTNSMPLTLELAPYTAGAMAAERAKLGTFDGDGVVFIDTSNGTSPVPYIAYAKPQGGMGIKELLFLQGDQEACQVSAGEYPCAKDLYGNDGSNSDASPVPSGTIVHLVGGVDDQGIIVESLSSAPALPANMIRFSTPFGNTSKVSNGTAIAPIKVLNDASCTLGVGCFGSNTQRLLTTISFGNSTSTTELVPGTIFTFGKSSIILLSIAGNVANFLVATK